MTFTRLFHAFTAVLLLAGAISAHAQTLGRTTVGATPSSALRPDYKRGSKFTLSQPATATQLCAYLDGGGAASGVQDFRLALYRTTGGVPDAKIAETPTWTVGAGAPGRWTCLDIGWTPMTAGDYWLMIHTGGSANGPARYYYDGTGNFLTNADAFADGASEQFGNGGAGNGTLSIYARYLPGSIATNAGRTSIGSTPSGVLRGDFKRGSSITFAQAGKVTALTAYLDSTENGLTPQSIRFALYEDVNGAPGPLVTQSLDTSLPLRTWGRWVTLNTPDATVHAGKYWLMLHTSSGEVFRYYFDGTGNWLGNADPWTDGSSNPFGVAGTGNGTVSAFATYQPSALIPNTFGRTTIASTPFAFAQGGLGSAYMALTRFELTASNATMTALYAYIDGLGSTSGTQQTRMVIYGEEGGWLAAGTKAVSNVITIAAGRQPGWVKYTIPPTSLPPGVYYIGLHTGNTPFVVRAYADAPGDAMENGEDVFEDGPSGSALNNDFEISPFGRALSVYATYTTP